MNREQDFLGSPGKEQHPYDGAATSISTAVPSARPNALHVVPCAAGAARNAPPSGSAGDSRSGAGRHEAFEHRERASLSWIPPRPSRNYSETETSTVTHEVNHRANIWGGRIFIPV